MGSIVGSKSGTAVIKASGQASWADLIWIKALKHMEGSTLPPALVSTLTWSEAVPFLLVLAGSCMVVYASLHHGAWTSPTMISFGWVFLTIVLGSM